jgi:hypothetical protein
VPPPTVTWKSSNDSIAYVNSTGPSTGNVVGVSLGNAQITAKDGISGQTAKVTVSVLDQLTGSFSTTGTQTATGVITVVLPGGKLATETVTCTFANTTDSGIIELVLSPDASASMATLTETITAPTGVCSDPDPNNCTCQGGSFETTDTVLLTISGLTVSGMFEAPGAHSGDYGININGTLAADLSSISGSVEFFISNELDGSGFVHNEDLNGPFSATQ